MTQLISEHPAKRGSTEPVLFLMRSPSGGMKKPGALFRMLLKAFMTGHKGSIVRRYTLTAYLRQGDRIDITTDASPWGIGCSQWSPWYCTGLCRTRYKKFGLRAAADIAPQRTPDKRPDASCW